MAHLGTPHDALPKLAVACVAGRGQERCDDVAVWDEALLTGSLSVPAEVQEERIPTVLVVVDDDSGSMGCGARQADGSQVTRCQAVAMKSQLLLQSAAEAGIPYSYCRFGHQHVCHGAVSPAVVPGLLRAQWGTQLMSLTDAAIEAATALTAGGGRGPLRIVFVLNTDGEAYDGDRAAAVFRSKFEGLCRERNIAAARSFVFGIGPSHDHRTLGAVSVGESSYFNFPDSELSRMPTDALLHVVPELTGGRRRVPVFIGAGRREHRVQIDGGEVSLDGIAVQHGEDCIAVAGAEPVQLHFRVLEMGSPEYWDTLMKVIRRDALRIAAEARECGQGAPDRERAKQLLGPVQRLKDLLQQVPDDTTVGQLRGRLRAALSAGDAEKAAQLRLELRVAQQKNRGCDERKMLVRDAIAMCSSAALSLSNGQQLHADIERDMMEFLSVGGYQRWGERRKMKLVSKQQEKANGQAVEEADARVMQLMDQMPAGSAAAAGDAEACWLTLCNNEQLAEQGDVLCLGGYVKPGQRRLAFAGVNSASVLHEAVLNGDVRICPFPLSFLTLRELLRGGSQIERAPDGGPINAVFCTLPAEGCEGSREIARVYQPLCTSQAVTSRWVFTEKAAEFRNGLMVAMQAGVVQGAGEAQRRTHRRAIDSLRRVFGPHWAKSCSERYAGFRDRHQSTSHEVPSVLMALADAAVAGERPPVGWWREVVFRIFRDCFGPWGKRSGADPEALLELVVQGLNASDECCEQVAGSLEGLYGPDSDFAFRSAGGMDVDADVQTLERMLGGLSLGTFQEDDEEGMGRITVFDPEEGPADCDDDDGKLSDVPDAKRMALDPCARAAAHRPKLQLAKKPWSAVARELMQERSGCAQRGAPTGDVGPTALQRCGPVQRLIIRAGIAQCRRELTLVLNTAAHFCDTAAVPSLQEVLGLQTEEELMQWLRAKFALALRLRDNARFRTEVEREGCGLLDAPVDEVLQQLNVAVCARNEAAYARAARTEAELRLMKLRVKYRRAALRMRETPDAWGCFIPLRIADKLHLAQLSRWTQAHRGFQIEPAETPLGAMTGMAINTMLSRGSPWFMRHANAKEAIAKTWGGRGRVTRTGDPEKELKECGPDDGGFAIVAALNLHVCAGRVLETDAEMDCASFCTQVARTCPARALSAVPCMRARLVELWVSHRMSRRQFFGRPVAQCMQELEKQLPAGDAEARLVLAVTCRPLHVWYNDPEQFLATPEFAVTAPTIDEFMAAANPEDEEAAAVANASFSKDLEDLSASCKVMKRKRDDDGPSCP